MSPPPRFSSDQSADAVRVPDNHTPFVRAVAEAVGGLRTLVDDRLRAVEGQLGEVRRLLASRQKDQLTVEEFADLVGRSPYTIRRWAAEGKIRFLRLAHGGPKGRLLIARAELDRVIASGSGGDVPPALMT